MQQNGSPPGGQPASQATTWQPTPATWQRLGARIREDRDRKGLGREDLQAAIRANGKAISTRTIQDIEAGQISLQDNRPGPMCMAVMHALGWPQGFWVGVVVDGKALFPWSPRPTRMTTAPMGQLITNLNAARPAHVEQALGQFNGAVRTARSGLMRAALSLTPSRHYADQASLTAARAARHLLTQELQRVLDELDEATAHQAAIDRMSDPATTMDRPHQQGDTP